MRRFPQLCCVLVSIFLAFAGLLPGQVPAQAGSEPWLTFAPKAGGPGAGKHIVFVTGEEEYRSEEGMPQLARILARMGFRCTVLFAIDPKTGAIDPGVLDNIPGLEALDSADLMVAFTRFRDLPDAQMQHFVDYVESGRPVIGLRTATHALDAKKHTTFRRWSWRNNEWDGGFGRQVLGETWVDHHGGHGWQSTLGIVVPEAKDHPILRGIRPGTVWDPSDVYTVRLPQPQSCVPLLLGEVLAGMTADSGPAKPQTDDKGNTRDLNAPRMPLAWTNTYRGKAGKDARVFATTLGAAQAFTFAGTRRLLVNACFWALGMESAITADLDVSLIGAFAPSAFGFGKHKPGVTPQQLRAEAALGHRVLLGADGRLVQLAADGSIEWQMPWSGIHDLHRLADGRVVAQRDGHIVSVIDPATKQVVWSYDSAKENGNQGKRVEVHAFQPLADGGMMIAESGPARIVEVDRAGKLLKVVPLTVQHGDAHRDTRLSRKLANGHYLVCHEGDGHVREYDADGKVVWDFAVPLFDRKPAGGHGPEAFGNQTFGAVRLPSGNTLLTTGNGHSVLEVEPSGKIVWALHQNDLPGITLAWVTTIEVLPSGNYVLGNCHAGPRQPVLIEIEPKSKRVVWTLDGHDRFGNSVSNSLVLDTESIR
jgi:hypothetical protein